MKILTTPGESDADYWLVCAQLCQHIIIIIFPRSSFWLWETDWATCTVVGFRGAHAAHCNFSVLSKIIGYPNLIIAAES